MNAWKRLDRGLEYLFLRLYAKNLARSFQSEPENASTDTEIQVSTIVGMAMFAIVLIMGSLLFPVYLHRRMNGGDWSIALLTVVSAIAVAVECYDADSWFAARVRAGFVPTTRREVFAALRLILTD